LRQLLARGASVRVIVRSAERLPRDLTGAPGLTVLQADLLSLSDDDLLAQLRGCGAVISCLGHTLSLKGIYGAPRDLVTQAAATVHRVTAVLQPAQPMKLIMMSSVSVNDPRGSRSRRGVVERAVLTLLRCVLPPALDNQRAADFLSRDVGSSDPLLEWVAVRPDTLLDGGASRYAVHRLLVDSLFAPGKTNIENAAHFMCELVTEDRVWAAWKGRLPVVVNAAAATGSQPEA
jgi:uncharacterized protein YbjT (DUF2867 family)